MSYATGYRRAGVGRAELGEYSDYESRSHGLHPMVVRLITYLLQQGLDPVQRDHGCRGAIWVSDQSRSPA